MPAPTSSDIIVIGGGVAGLAAARDLGRRGYTVTLLEARDRLGGRVFTVRPKGWNHPVELGAEFIHSGNPAFWRLIKTHRLATRHPPSRHWLFRENRLEPVDDVAERIEQVTSKIKPVRMRGWSFADFIHGKTGAFSPEDRNLAAGFVEGFQAAPAGRMSAPAVQGETLDDEEQFLLPRGYDRLVAALAAE